MKNSHSAFRVILKTQWNYYHTAMFKILVLCFLAFFWQQAIAQEDSININRKTYSIAKMEQPPKIDALGDDEAWQSIPFATDFVQRDPNNGKPEREGQNSKVKMGYDDDNVYLYAELHDNEPDKILTQVGSRDDSGIADLFCLMLNPYNDSQQAFLFFVSSTGVQMDAFTTSSSNDDFNWDAVWASKTRIDDKGWYVEMKIPYSAIRMPQKNVQEWGINFWRELRRSRETYNWNYTDNSKGNALQYFGKLEGIQNITPPTRLFLIPYASVYYETFDGENNTQFKAGADLKWGLNDSFTLDAILVPDFGQAGFDNLIKNLGPFEQQLAERRPFFTEGIDLFTKGNLFYSRRIGGNPTLTNLNNEEYFESLPTTVNLINALKISGRTTNGWGLGVLNAITERTTANVLDANTDEFIRQQVVEPLANYNLLVADKRYGNNSYISFINTSVLRENNGRDANVSGVIWQHTTQNNHWQYQAETKSSWVIEEDTQQGAFLQARIQEIAGQWRYGITGQYISPNYNINDLGINFRTNYFYFNPYVSYRILTSTEKFNSLNLTLSYFQRIRGNTGKTELSGLNFNWNSTLKSNNDYYGFGFEWLPFETFDYYEPRTTDRFFINPKSFFFWFYNSPNYNKKFVLDKEFNFEFTSFDNNASYTLGIGPIWRISDHFTLNASVYFKQELYDRGFVDKTNEEIVFGSRNLNELTTNLGATYNFNPNLSLNLNFRHYWLGGDYQSFFFLKDDGTLAETNDYTKNQDFSFNLWNLDLGMSWWLAPGSQLTFLYRNQLSAEIPFAEKNYFNNLDQLFSETGIHTFSIRLNYFIDYSELKKWFKPKNYRDVSEISRERRVRSMNRNGHLL